MQQLFDAAEANFGLLSHSGPDANLSTEIDNAAVFDDFAHTWVGVEAF
ncbi:hypothetical protein OIHEL45_20746 [Sulfitobacter indolifex HEL-45]|uniref:Uncharacterized protein n=1 Tax=Sulfitobacter indolifex HEL-45 TaxID=391624 RepID=A0ABP2D6L8_9RHOB|nr:hypothetical protein OIHEL45_20746 [Sulfitobacter indolifex HEL-45]